MSRHTLQPLRKAIKQALHEAHAARRTSRGSAIAVLALSAATLAPRANALDYTADGSTDLYALIGTINADGDTRATITFTGNITLSSTTAFPALTKPITINTSGFTLNGQSGTQPGGSLPFSGNTVTIAGTGALRGGDGLSGNVNGSVDQSGGAGISMTNGAVVNSASITGGRSGDNGIANVDLGGAGVLLTNGSVTNSGSITGGLGGNKTAGDGTTGGPGQGGSGVTLTTGALTNNGVITGGRGGDYTGTFGLSGAIGGIGANLLGGSHVNNGTIRGGASGVNPTTGSANNGGVGVQISNGATFLNNAGALVEAGATTGQGTGTGLVMGGNNTSLINHGTIRGGQSSQTVVTNGGFAISTSGSGAQTMSITNTGTIEAGATGPAIYVGNFPLINVGLTVVNSGTIRAGTNQPNAIVFGVNAASPSTLELQPGSVIFGNVTAGSPNINDTFRLGGSGADTLDASSIGSKYTGFSVFEKNNTSTWMLAGTSSALSPWRLLGGTLSVSQDGSLGGAAGALTFNTGTLQNTAAFTSARAVTLNAGGGTFDAAADLTWSGLIGGAGALTKSGSSALILTGSNNYTGATNVNAGTLRVNGNQSAATGLTTVASGATLGGSGTIGGAVTIADGGHLAPGNSPGTLTMGSLTLNTGSVLDFELGQANVAGGALNDLVNVNGNLVLDGTLNVTASAGGTFGAGVYRLINYTGTLTDNGLDLGLLPASSVNSVQTSIAHEVNLINTQGLVLNYWDGAADGLNNGAVGGGDGLWQAKGNEYWTTADGSLNAAYASGSMAIFAGNPGTVTVDASKGDVRVAGMQFATDGYRVQGDAITLTSGLNTVRVGDGTDAGRTFIATIASALTGAGTLDKSDLGTLVLTGENTYSGDTMISAGTLQIGNGGTSGSIVGDVANEGVLAFDRADVVSFGGVISGNGSVSQMGSGSTTLTGVNTYTGTTTIASGTLALNGAGSIAASSSVVDQGIFDISATDAGASVTTLSGNGSVVLGSKSLTLTAPATTFAGAIDGAAGTLNKAGSGTWTLTGTGSEVGALNVQAGTLELASSGALAAHATSISAGATLQSDGTFTGTPGPDTFLLAGTFIGQMNFGDGDDHLQVTEGADFSHASFVGGAGVDTLQIVNNNALALPATLTTGFEQLVKDGTGVLTLSGKVDQFGNSITVESGTAQLSDANIVTNALNIESAGTVMGTGSLSGQLINAGTLSMGNSPGALHVGGNYVQIPGGTFVSAIRPTGTDLLDVTGSATLAGIHQIQIQYGLYLDGTTQTLMRAAGGITGKFDSLQINPSALMKASYQLSANTESVSFARQPFTTLVNPESGRGRFATWLEEQVTDGQVTPQMNDYIDSLLQQPTAQGATALLGERSAPVANLTQNSVSMLGAAFAGTVFERFTASDMAQCAPTQQGSSDTLNCFWAHGLREWGHARGDTHYDWMTDGGQFGVDRDLSSGLTVGATFGYADANTHDTTGGNNDARSKMGGLYGNYAPGRLNIGALTFYSGNSNDTRRNVQVDGLNQQARASFDSDSYGMGVRVGYRLSGATGPLVRPFVEAFYNHINGADVSETGAGDGDLNARVHGRDGARGTLGVEFANNFEAYGAVVRPALELGVAHEFADVRSIIDLQPFSDAPAFRTSGPSLDRTSFVARASVNVSVGKNASVALGYAGQAGDNISQHEANLSFNVAW